MKKQSAKTLQSFEFKPDFTGQHRPQPSLVTLGAAELAAMLEEARQAGAMDVRTDVITREAERMDQIASDLSTALKELVGLAHHMETLGLQPSQLESIHSEINAACARILDGQGDLFVEPSEG